MEKRYWLGRQQDAEAMAGQATDGESRLIHFDMAGRYAIKAAQTGAPICRPAAR
jgi:hypothetical protein